MGKKDKEKKHEKESKEAKSDKNEEMAKDKPFIRNPYHLENRKDDKGDEETLSKKELKKLYEKELELLQIELVKLQNWVKDKGKRLLVIFEGIDTAGKGGTIKRITEHLNPRGLRVVALSKPSDIEKTQWYFQRYSSHLPSGGEIVLFDRSWYNRAGVERVMGFCTNEEYQKFFRQVTSFEEMLVDDGIMFFKYYLTITKEEQSARIAARKTDPLKMWKLSPVDLAAHEHYDDYKEAEKEMFIRTHTPYAPWIIVDANDKRKARLNIIRDLLIHIDYDEKDRDAIGATDPHIIRLYSHLTYK